MSKEEMFTAVNDIRNILTDIVAQRGERGERSLVVHADNARPHIAKVTRAFCDDDFLRIVPHPHLPDSPDLAPSDFFLFLVSCLSISKIASKDSNSDLQMNFFQESQKFWTKSALTFWNRFSGSEWINRLDRCIVAFQHCSKWKVREME
jgi:hypothetical protein